MADQYALSVTFRAIDQLSDPVRRMERGVIASAARMERAIMSVTRVTDHFGRSLANAGRTALRVTTIGVSGFGAALVYVMKQFSKMENAEAAFTPLLRGADQAKKTVDELNQLAVVTPFRFEHLSDAAQKLFSQGAADKDNLIDKLRMLGDVSGGNADRLSRIALVYGQVVSATKANARDMMQFVDAGVPLKKMIAELMNVDISNITELTTQGKISADIVTKALEKATAKGGMFYQTMSLGNKTTEGIFNQLVNNIQLAAARLGGAISDQVKKLMGEMDSFVVDFSKNLKDPEFLKKVTEGFINFTESLKGLVLFLMTNWKWITKLIVVLYALVKVTGLVIGALALFNLAMTLGATGAMIAGIYALIFAVSSLWIWWDQLYAYNPLLADSLYYLVVVVGSLVAAFYAWKLILLIDLMINKALYAAMIALRGATLGLTGAQWLLNAALLANPIVLIVAGIMLAVGAVALLITYWDELYDRFSNSLFGKVIIIFLTTVYDLIMKAIDGLKELAQFLGLLDRADSEITSNGSRNGETVSDAMKGNDYNFDDDMAVVTPQDRTSESISREIIDQRSSIDMTINDNSRGRVEVTQTGSRAARITTVASGGFES